MAKKLLFIEDEAAIHKTLSDVLQQEGYETISALDGEAGLQRAQAEIPDLILLDLILPKMNGFEVLQALKADEKTKGIPVIILTNLEQMENVQKAIDLGATTYLVKANYSLEEVVRKVEEALES